MPPFSQADEIALNAFGAGLTDDLPEWAAALRAFRLLWHDYGIAAELSALDAIRALRLDQAERQRAAKMQEVSGLGG
jgi:hypothetical protein